MENKMHCYSLQSLVNYIGGKEDIAKQLTFIHIRSNYVMKITISGGKIHTHFHDSNTRLYDHLQIINPDKVCYLQLSEKQKQIMESLINI